MEIHNLQSNRVFQFPWEHSMESVPLLVRAAQVGKPRYINRFIEKGVQRFVHSYALIVALGNELQEPAKGFEMFRSHNDFVLMVDSSGRTCPQETPTK